MSQANPQMRKFAQRLLIDDRARKKNPAATKQSVDFNTCDKLRPIMATLMGTRSYHALLSRALVLAQAEVPWLHAVQVKANGTLETVEEHHAELDPAALVEGRVVVIAQLLGLMVAFIGDKLTLSLVREVWPNAKLDGLAFGTEGKKNEKRK